MDRIDAGGARHLDVVTHRLGVDQPAEFAVDGGEHFGQLLDLGNSDAARDERLGHLKPDVAGADDHRSPDLLLFEGSHQGEAVFHRVQKVHALPRAKVVEAGDRRPDRQRSRGDNERVVLEKLDVMARSERYAVALSIDLPCDSVEP